MKSSPTLTIKLCCVDLPGRNFDGKTQIRVGVQKADEVVEDVLGDRTQVEFACAMRVEQNLKTGKPNFLGPYAHGKPEERFIYLCWGERKVGGWHGFRRAKIHLKHLDWKTVENALKNTGVLEAEVKLTDRKGEPLCASVKADHIRWNL